MLIPSLRKLNGKHHSIGLYNLVNWHGDKLVPELSRRQQHQHHLHQLRKLLKTATPPQNIVILPKKISNTSQIVQIDWFYLILKRYFSYFHSRSSEMLWDADALRHMLRFIDQHIKHGSIVPLTVSLLSEASPNAHGRTDCIWLQHIAQHIATLHQVDQVPTGSNTFQQVPTGSNRFRQVWGFHPWR